MILSQEDHKSIECVRLRRPVAKDVFDSDTRNKRHIARERSKMLFGVASYFKVHVACFDEQNKYGWVLRLKGSIDQTTFWNGNTGAKEGLEICLNHGTPGTNIYVGIFLLDEKRVSDGIAAVESVIVLGSHKLRHCKRSGAVKFSVSVEI